MADSWNFRKRDATCSDCSRSFQEGEEVYSLLRLAEDELQRGDACRACFDQRDATQDVVFWRTTHSEKKGAVMVDFDLLLAAMEGLAADQREDRKDLCYLLALLLVRHRKLRLERVEMRGAKEFLILRKVRSQNRFPVESRELESERRQKLTAVLADLLDPTQEGDLSGAFDQVPQAEEADGDSAAEPQETGNKGG
ncbi:MAG: hypothetical protein ACYSU1_03130 [Planctomycetota bacterium]|jgi:hypothetical protein